MTLELINQRISRLKNPRILYVCSTPDSDRYGYPHFEVLYLTPTEFYKGLEEEYNTFCVEAVCEADKIDDYYENNVAEYEIRRDYDCDYGYGDFGFYIRDTALPMGNTSDRLDAYYGSVVGIKAAQDEIARLIAEAEAECEQEE